MNIEPPTAHVVTILEGGAHRARCRCGWAGPDRTPDPQRVRIALDDAAWHMDEVQGVAG